MELPTIEIVSTFPPTIFLSSNGAIPLPFIADHQSSWSLGTPVFENQSHALMQFQRIQTPSDRLHEISELLAHIPARRLGIISHVLLRISCLIRILNFMWVR